MKLFLVTLLASTILGLTSFAYADEPVTVTLSELAESCGADIGRLYVELRATQIRASKFQAEVEKLKEAAKPKAAEKK